MNEPELENLSDQEFARVLREKFRQHASRQAEIDCEFQARQLEAWSSQLEALESLEKKIFDVEQEIGKLPSRI